MTVKGVSGTPWQSLGKDGPVPESGQGPGRPVAAETDRSLLRR